MKETPTSYKYLCKKDIVVGMDRSRRVCGNWEESMREVSGSGDGEIKGSEGFVDLGCNGACIGGEYHGKKGG